MKKCWNYSWKKGTPQTSFSWEELVRNPSSLPLLVQNTGILSGIFAFKYSEVWPTGCKGNNSKLMQLVSTSNRPHCSQCLLSNGNVPHDDPCQNSARGYQNSARGYHKCGDSRLKKRENCAPDVSLQGAGKGKWREQAVLCVPHLTSPAAFS